MLFNSVRHFSLFLASAGGFALVTFSVGMESTLNSVNIAIRLSSSWVINWPDVGLLVGLVDCLRLLLTLLS